MRLFLALAPPSATCRALLGFMHGLPGARWQNEAQLHVTMRFIGDVDRHIADALILALHHERFAPVAAQLDGFGHFERRGRIDQLWAGLAPRDSLAALHARLDRLCVRCGLEPEGRKYVPHITLARFTRSTAPGAWQLGEWLSAQPPLPRDAIIFDQLVLMESRLGTQGSVYEPLAQVAMRG